MYVDLAIEAASTDVRKNADSQLAHEADGDVVYVDLASEAASMYFTKNAARQLGHGADDSGVYEYADLAIEAAPAYFKGMLICSCLQLPRLGRVSPTRS